MDFKKFVSILMLSTLLLPNIAAAQSVPSPDPDPPAKDIGRQLPPVQLQPGEKDPGTALSPMKRGQRAPFTGVLLSPAAVANVVVEMESFEERLHIEVVRSIQEERAAGDKRLSDANAASTADKKVLQANLDASKTEADAYKKELKDLRDSQPNTYLWAGLGALGGVAFTLLTVFAVTQVTK